MPITAITLPTELTSDANNIARVGRELTIDTTSSSVATIDLYISYDDGSNYEPTSIGSITTSGGSTFDWTPVTGDKSETVKIKAVNNANGTDFQESTSFIVRDVSVSLTAPSGSVNGNGNSNTAGNGLGIHVNAPCAIQWVDSATGADKADNVKLELSANGGTSYAYTVAASTANNKQYVFVPSSHLGTVHNDACRIKITTLNGATPDPYNWAVTSTDFEVKTVDIFERGVTSPWDTAYPQVFTAYGRVQAERGANDDEAVTRGTLVAGDGISITKKGLTSGTDYYHNVFSVTRPAARTFKAIVTCNQDPADSYDSANGKFGKHYYADVAHNFSLTDPEDIVVTCINLDDGSPITSVTIPQVEYLDTDTVRIHAVKKTASEGAIPITQSMRFQVNIVENTDLA